MITRFLNSDLFAYLIFAAMIYITVRLDKHGTTQLRPDLVAKELAEVSTMRARGAHFAPLKKKTIVYEDTPKNVKVDLNDYLFLTENRGEDE